MKRAITLAAGLTACGLFSISCQTAEPDRKLTDAKPAPANPYPAWTEHSAGMQGDQRILITAKLIEITRPEGSADVPAKQYRRTLTEPQFQVFVRDLVQKKGVDLMSAPSVVARDGQKAKIEVIREFIYPVAPGEGAKLEVENVGVTAHLNARHAGGSKVDLKSYTRVSEFDGFSKVSPEFELPVFKRRDVDSSALLASGETIVVGGIVDEIEQEIEDKGPLGILRRRSTETFSRELIIAVTPSLIDPEGKKVAAR